jgi:serine/threonine protein kinase
MDGDLSKMINKHKNGMSSKLVRKIFLQLNTALKEMIKRGKVHRDLKPSNILFSYTNDKQSDFIIKIGDFGLAADLVSTKTLSNAGTELFKAPEVGKGRFSNKCDLYSLGIILYMLKTGEYIFEGNSLYEKLTNKNKNIIKKETDDPLLNNLIKKLLVINPKERMEWKDYFNDPFFKVNDIKENLECKNTNFKFR